METDLKWDASLYPDCEMPDMETADKFDRADYLHRPCSDIDFGFMPDSINIEAIANDQ